MTVWFPSEWLWYLVCDLNFLCGLKICNVHLLVVRRCNRRPLRHFTACRPNIIYYVTCCGLQPMPCYPRCCRAHSCPLIHCLSLGSCGGWALHAG